LIIGVFGAWAAWELINTATKSLLSRARRTHSYIDDMTLLLRNTKRTSGEELAHYFL
jgi:hypothetical protein